LALNKIIKHKNILVISDDPYRYILFDKKFYSFAQINKEQTIIVDSISKSHSVPGWRLGWAAGPAEIIKAMNKLQGQICGNVCNLAQMAGIKALSLPKNTINPWIKEYNKRRNYLITELSKIKELSFIVPEGAFYFFINIYKITKNSVAFCEQLLKKEKLVLVPGKAFGLDGFVRWSFAFSMKDLKEAIKRLNNFINKYGR
jgi:aspartate aminotransferase